MRRLAAGLRLAADGEFFAGTYRLRLTSAAVRASRGEWDQAVHVLEELVASPGEPGIMAVLARSVLARLLARRGDPRAGPVLDAAVGDAPAAEDCCVAGPLAVARIELDWLAGRRYDVPGAAPLGVTTALRLAAASGHRADHSELCGYPRRAGADLADAHPGGPELAVLVREVEPTGPWRAALRGRSEEAAAAWETLGERYEQAVELASCSDGASRAAGLRMLDGLGAGAAVARLLSPSGPQSPATGPGRRASSPGGLPAYRESGCRPAPPHRSSRP